MSETNETIRRLRDDLYERDQELKELNAQKNLLRRQFPILKLLNSKSVSEDQK